MKKPKVILGMSGGVDSSVAAYLLQKQGYEVVGFFMNCGPRGTTMWPSTINWQEDEAQLRAVAKKLGIEIIMADCELGYEKKVVSKMVSDYKKGLTPNPDILCNNVGKFPQLYKHMKMHNAQFIATGHYARIKHDKNGAHLLQGKDTNKDQSYFLVGLGQQYLKKCLFPIGELTKQEVREIAKKLGFKNWNKRSSRGICYLGKIDVKEFLKSRVPPKPGAVIDENKNKIGSHPGAMYFTIGEKVGPAKGVVLDKNFKRTHAQKKLFVARKHKNTITVVPQNSPLLKTKRVKLIKFKRTNPKAQPPTKLNARIRHLGELHPATLTKKDNARICTFARGVNGVAPGQLIALYKDEELIAGGEIRLLPK